MLGAGCRRPPTGDARWLRSAAAQVAQRGEHMATPHLVTNDAAQQQRRVVGGLTGAADG
jgi:hypothetical protein